jgi:hypothetical protein
MAEEVRKPDHKASNLRDEISNIMTKTATPFASTQDSNPHSRLIASVSDQRPRIHNFYTKASILSPKGIVNLEQVQVDERSLFNLLP